ncbi:ABC transporter substrate-binding protein [Actinoplanes sp. RD1]|uniref:ABC transporter substrate-binding protein n=1 Tax=Actinoplanes sp. RD1 TaxID=3064538 RepID=UPI002742100B|nr:ABC transporter substrate-binding protein [Actinoplanes sp. RD1]
MRLPRRLTASVAASALVMSALAGCDSGSDSGAKTDVVIGADLASSDPVDAAYARALQLRVEQINASGQLPAHNLVLRILDNGGDPRAAVPDVGTLAADSSVAALITGSCNECTANSAKTISDQKIPAIALATADGLTTPIASHRYLFKLGPNSADSTAVLTAELVRAKQEKVAILYANDLYGKKADEQIEPLLKKAGIDITGRAAIRPESTDVTAAVTGLLEEEPGALVVLTGPEQATLAATKAKAAQFPGRIYFDAAAAGDLFLSPQAAAATDDTTMVFTQTLAIDDVIATTPAKAARKQWFRDYTARYGSYSGVAAFAADAVSLIADAVARAGNDREQLRDILETSQTDGLSGPIRLTPDNHSALMPQALTLLVARSGRWRLLS